MPTDNIRVLHVIGRFNVGGTANYLLSLSPKLSKEGVETLLAVGRVQSGEVEESRLEDIAFRRIESLGRRIDPIKDFHAFLSLRKVVREFNPDIIHTHTFKAGLLARVMFIRIPKVHTFHGHLFTDPEFTKFEVKLIAFAERVLAMFTDSFITTGQNVGVELAERKVIKLEDFTSIPGEVISEKEVSRMESRENFGLDSEFTILWVARLAPVKNARLLLEIASRMPDLIFLVAGDGPESEIIKSISPPNVRILGFVEARKLLSSGDLFVSTSLNEGFPLAILQAQLAGLPVIAVDVGAVNEIVIHGLTGFLTQPDAKEMERRIRQLYLDSELRNSMGKFAKKNARIRNSQNEMGKKHVEVYLSILKNKRDA
jgi:glycosyltransferase involved in cell wall biosynthesis